MSEADATHFVVHPITEPGGDGSNSVASSRSDFIAFLQDRPTFLAGYVLITLIALLGLVAPWLPVRSPVDADAGAYLLAPSWAHPMGTDVAGLDIFARVLFAPRVDLMIALVSTIGAAAIGGPLGAYVGLWENTKGIKNVAAVMILRSADIIQAFPVFALALVLVAVLGQGVASIVIAIAVVNVPTYLRLMRGEALTIRTQGYVEGRAYCRGGRHLSSRPPRYSECCAAASGTDEH